LRYAMRTAVGLFAECFEPRGPMLELGSKYHYRALWVLSSLVHRTDRASLDTANPVMAWFGPGSLARVETFRVAKSWNAIRDPLGQERFDIR
jgi:hypothetical protein